MAPRRKCPVCGSKQWHKEPSSGLITCSEGHVLQNYRNETTEVGELGHHAVKKRTLKSGRKKKEKHSKADIKLYHGERMRFHYFQCLQLVLRMQVVSLTRLWQLPSEFETVCRDLWALHLSLLPNPPSAEPLLHLQDEMGINHTPKVAVAQAGEDVVGQEDHNGNESDGNKNDASSSSSSSDSEESDLGSELEELMRENSETSWSDDEGHDDSGMRHKANMPIPKKRRTFGPYDVPANTVAVLIVACWTLRLPVMYMDFVRLIECYDLPYLDALRLVPENMTRHLRRQTVQALSPHNPPSPQHLHRLSSRFARLLHSSYEIYTPEMNAAPVLWRTVRNLQGTPTLYVLTKKLARLVSIPLTLHRSLAPTLVRKNKRDPGFHKQDNAIPEVALSGAVIVVMKMVHGLDGQLRLPCDRHDPACALPTLSELVREIRNAEESDMKHAPAFSMATHRSVLDMGDRTIDEYLAFCEKALLPREDRMPPRNATTDQFPLHRELELVSSNSAVGGEESPSKGLPANTIQEECTNLRPGEQYTIYNTQDVLGTLPEDMDIVISRAAKWAGVDEAYVSGVVERFERRVVRWWDQQKRKDREARVSAST